MTPDVIEYAELTPAHCEGVTIWGEEHAEYLRHETIDEATEDYLDAFYPCDELAQKDSTYSIILTGHKRMELSESDIESAAEFCLEYFIERWDEDYGSPDDATTITEGMKQAARAFAEVMRREYRVWACEPIVRVRVPVRAWVERHCPEWLEEGAET